MQEEYRLRATFTLHDEALLLRADEVFLWLLLGKCFRI